MIKQHLVISLLLFVNLVLQGVDQHKGFWEPSGGVFRKVVHTHVAFNKKNKNIYFLASQAVTVKNSRIRRNGYIKKIWYNGKRVQALLRQIDHVWYKLIYLPLVFARTKK